VYSFHGVFLVVIGAVLVAVLIAISRALIILAITGGVLTLIGCYLFFVLDSSYWFVSVLMTLMGVILLGVCRIFRRIT
jgi:hypothetical protein